MGSDGLRHWEEDLKMLNSNKTGKKEGESIMKKLPKANVSSEYLYRMLIVQIRSKLLVTTIGLVQK